MPGYEGSSAARRGTIVLVPGIGAGVRGYIYIYIYI